MEEEIKYHAYFDSLTDLPNRVLLKDRLTQGLTYAQLHAEKLAVLYLDLDRFKFVNDTLGHSFGDLLLREVANRLSACVPKSATVSRQGGMNLLSIYRISKVKRSVKGSKLCH